MSSAVIFQVQSLMILTLIYIGVYYRRNRARHIKIMGSAISWDILLILQIELGRGAIAKASNAVNNKMLLNIHVSFAVLSVLLYFALIYTGRKVLAGDNQIKPLHKKFGLTCVAMRTLTFITSFWAVSPQS